MALLGFLKVRPIIKTETEVIWERISKNLISLAIISGALVSLVNQRQINSQSLEDAQASGLKSLGPINQPRDQLSTQIGFQCRC